MKDLKSSLDTQMNNLSDNLEANFNELWDEAAEADDLIVDGDEAEPPRPQPFKLDGFSMLSDEEDDDEEEVMVVNQPQGGPPAAAGAPAASGAPGNFFAQLAHSLRVPTDVGDHLDKSLAELVNHIFQHPLPTEEFVRQKEGTLRPGNCIQLQVPPVPEAIWVKVSGELTGRDKATQKLHGDFLCFLFKVLRCLDTFHA